MKKLLLLLSFLYLPLLLICQSTPYDISQYKARYDKRAGLSLFPRLDYSGFYGNAFDEEDTNFGFNIPANWFLQRNMDAKIVNWFAFANATGYIDQEATIAGQRRAFNTFSHLHSVSREVFNYYQPKSFWGWNFSISNSLSYNSTFLTKRSLQTAPSVSIFHGSGRIEFAQDALLANWMMSELAEAGVISDYSPEEVEILAQTITELVGDRTFDLRRRRIYQLRRLSETLLNEGVATKEQFGLFAILNDNWNYSFQRTIKNGRQLRYGLSSFVSYTHNKFQNDLSSTSDAFNSQLFVGYENAKIINNRGNRVWGARLSGGYFSSQLSNSIIENEYWETEARVALTYNWLTNSRTTFAVLNQVGWSHQLSPNGNRTSNVLRFDSRFSVNYFLTYNWTILLNTGFVTQYTANGRENNPYEIRPYLRLSSNYFFF